MRGSVSVDVELDDILWELSTSQKRDLLETLNKELKDLPGSVEDLFKGKTANDQDFGMDLLSLWRDRDSLTQEQKSRIKEITKESWV